jgi:hypothetical protein
MRNVNAVLEALGECRISREELSSRLDRILDKFRCLELSQRMFGPPKAVRRHWEEIYGHVHALLVLLTDEAKAPLVYGGLSAALLYEPPPGGSQGQFCQLLEEIKNPLLDLKRKAKAVATHGGISMPGRHDTGGKPADLASYTRLTEFMKLYQDATGERGRFKRDRITREITGRFADFVTVALSPLGDCAPPLSALYKRAEQLRPVCTQTYRFWAVRLTDRRAVALAALRVPDRSLGFFRPSLASCRLVSSSL